MTAIEIACPVCDQQPYELCINPDKTIREITHQERIQDAAAVTTSPNPASIEDFDKAVEGTGVL